MKTLYNVRLIETVRYVLTISARSEEEAREIAIEQWEQGRHDDGEGDGVSVDLVMPHTGVG